MFTSTSSPFETKKNSCSPCWGVMNVTKQDDKVLIESSVFHPQSLNQESQIGTSFMFPELGKLFSSVGAHNRQICNTETAEYKWVIGEHLALQNITDSHCQHQMKKNFHSFAL